MQNLHFFLLHRDGLLEGRLAPGFGFVRGLYAILFSLV